MLLIVVGERTCIYLEEIGEKMEEDDFKENIAKIRKDTAKMSGQTEEEVGREINNLIYVHEKNRAETLCVMYASKATRAALISFGKKVINKEDEGESIYFASVGTSIEIILSAIPKPDRIFMLESVIKSLKRGERIGIHKTRK